MIQLLPYSNEKELLCKLIKEFWKCHNNYTQTETETEQDFLEWTSCRSALYFIEKDGETVGFVRLGSRGDKCDWLEDIFVLPSFQRQGIGSQAIKLAEQIVKSYSECMYIEISAQNESAIKLYRKLGYDCLNTVTVRKDFLRNDDEVITTEKLYGISFDIRK